jgi:DNA invertase Pin-like site-specific DNA recombinase
MALARTSLIRAAIYCRISYDPMGRALGVERQRQDCREIAARKGWTVVDEYIDNHVSASKYSRKARKEYLRLLSDIEAGGIDAVVIWMEDRLQRQVLEVAEFLKVCEKAGVSRIASVGGEFDLADPDQRTMLYIKAAMAEAEVEKLRSRVRRQRLQAAERGEHHSGGRRGFGFQGRKRLSDGTTVPAVALAQVEQERALINEAVERVLAGEAINSIAADWKQRGIITPYGNFWSNLNIRQMLLSPAIAGYRVHQGKLYEEPIVPRDHWETLKALLDDPARSINKRGRPAGHLLTGLIVCGLCDHRLVVDYNDRAGGRRVRVYKCKPRVAYGGCGRISRMAEPLEELITEALFQAVEGPALERHLELAANKNDPTADLYRKLMTDRALLDGLEDHLADGLLTAEAYKRQRTRIEERMDGTRAKLASAQSGRTVADIPENLREVWPSYSLGRRRAILAAVLNKISVYPQGKTPLDPNSIVPDWKV